jgi:hypothetical protein
MYNLGIGLHTSISTTYQTKVGTYLVGNMYLQGNVGK